ncbi:MAG TPA: glycosyltransferase 87 family protein [Burkholderiales bacterium]
MRPGALRLLAWYAATRALMLLALLGVEHVVLMDPRNWLVELDGRGVRFAMPEYPWPAVLLLDLPLRLGVPTILHYFAVVVVFLLAVDAALAVLLWRAAGRRPSAGLWLWLLAVPALGPLVFARFDLLPAVLAVAALLAVPTRPSAAGALAALGTSLKLWPALVLPALFVARERAARPALVAGFAFCLAAAAIVTAVAAGWPRLGSPFAALGMRGLHLEAFAALPLAWARYLDGGARWLVRFSEACHCHEIVGPGVALAVAAGRAALLAATAFVAALYWRALRAGGAREPGAAAVLVAASLLAWMVGAKVLSPQYLLWLAAPLAAAGALSAAALSRLEVALLVAAAALTHLVYPLGYEALVVQSHPLQGPLLVVLTLRDALLLALGARLAHRAWRTSAGAPASSKIAA